MASNNVGIIILLDTLIDITVCERCNEAQQKSNKMRDITEL